jgi:hypothetical protein
VQAFVKEFIGNVFTFCHLVFKRAPLTAKDHLQHTVSSMYSCVKSKDNSMQKLEKDLEDLVKEMRAELEKQEKASIAAEALKRQTRGQFKDYELAAFDEIEAPSDFRELSIIPLMEELKSKEPVFLVPNKKKGCFPSANKYLDIQFRLLREDFVQPLRKGIQEFLAHP